MNAQLLAGMILCLLVLIGAGCASLGEQKVICSPVSLSTKVEDISAEIGTLPRDAQVATIAFSRTEKSLLVAYEFDSLGQGAYAKIDPLTGRIQGAHSLDAISLGYAHFASDGKVLGAKAIPCDHPSFDLCWQVVVFDGESNKIEWDGGKTTALSSLSFSKNGNVVFRGASPNSLDDLGTHTGINFGKSYTDRSESITASSLDSEGQLLAIGIKEQNYLAGQVFGEIVLQEWTGTELRPPTKFSLGSVQLNDAFRQKLDEFPTFINIAPNRKWLGVIAKNFVYLFHVSPLKQEKSISGIPSSSTETLTFNEGGNLMAIGHSRGLTILSVPELKTVMEIPSKETTSVAFSPDGCLLAWGDVEGTVHIINAPKP